MAFGEHDHKKPATEHVTHSVHVRSSDSEEKKPVRMHKPMSKPDSVPVEKTKLSIDESLRSIYSDESGEIPDMTKLEHHRSKLWLLILAGIVAVGLAVGAAYIGYLVFSPYIVKSDAKISVQIEAPETIPAFEDVSLDIAYKNSGTENIGTGELKINYPPEFHLVESDPMPSTGTSIFSISNLGADKTAHIILKGFFIAESGTQAFFQTIARYSPVGMSQKYEDIATKTVNINGSKLAISMDAPNEIVAGEKTTITFRAQNNSGRRVENILFSPKFAASFLIGSSTPKIETDGIVKIGTLDNGQEAKITVVGTFSANHEDNENIGGALLVQKDTTRIPQNETVSPIKIASSELQLRTLVNGSGEDQSVNSGGNLRLSLIYKNEGNRAMKDVTASFTLDAAPDELIDWKKFDTATEKDKTFMRKGETITITPKMFKAFQEIAPGTEGTLSWVFPLKTEAVAGAKDYSIKVTSRANIGTIGKVKVAKTVETTPFTIIPNTDLNLVAGARYFDEDLVPIGSGPIPPIVGEETKYMVLWNLENSVHEVKDLLVKTQLAEGVTWTGKTLSENGALNFDEGTRTVTWKLDSMPREISSVSAQFEVAITPKQSQFDSFAPLTTGATMTATDALTKAIITRTNDPDTTEVPLDKNATGKGLVELPAKKK
ncbi:MAG: hypothetical protein WCJ29_05720 [bacterium]